MLGRHGQLFLDRGFFFFFSCGELVEERRRLFLVFFFFFCEIFRGRWATLGGCIYSGKFAEMMREATLVRWGKKNPAGSVDR